MKKNRNFLGLAILVFALITSCGKMPQAEVDTAKAALDSLIAHGADKILADDFEDLQEKLDEVLEMVEKQGSKMFKSFGEAKDKLAGVVEDAAELEEKNDEKKAELLGEVDELMAEVGTINNDSKNMIPKTGNISAQQLVLRKDAYAVDAALEEIKTMLEENDLVVAMEKLEELKVEAERINADLKVIKPANSKPVKKPRTTSTTSGTLRPSKK